MVFNIFTRNYPRNYMVQSPVKGAFLAFSIILIFLLLYRPLDLNDNKILGFTGAMIVYSFLGCTTSLAMIILLKKIPSFSDKARWTLTKELFLIFICLFMMSLVIFASGFLIEIGGNPDFFLSAKFTFLLGILPYAIFTVRNFSSLFPKDNTFIQYGLHESETDKSVEEKIHIESKLKTESLSFYPSQFLLAESEGNYVTFYFMVDNKVEKSIIRNSISHIENQLGSFESFFKTHRAFIVNLNKVKEKSGNVLGYKLKLNGVDKEIPVSRQNTKHFNKRMDQLSAYL